MVLSIDYGLKRTGIATSDENEIFAFALETITNANEEKVLQRIAHLVQENNIDAIVIGLPVNSDNTDTEMSKRIRKFSEKVYNFTGIEVEFWNEIYTSEIAKTNIQGFKKGKESIDSEAARLILQEYLDNKRIETK